MVLIDILCLLHGGFLLLWYDSLPLYFLTVAIYQILSDMGRKKNGSRPLRFNIKQERYYSQSISHECNFTFYPGLMTTTVAASLPLA